MNHFTLIEEAFPSLGAMDVAVSHSILSAVGSGEINGVFRLYVPGPIVAFGRADRMTPGYLDAVRAACANGFTAVERLAGGRAVVFHESTLAFSWAVPDPEPPAHTIHRFEIIASLMQQAFQSLGVDARVGELPGEYNDKVSVAIIEAFASRFSLERGALPNTIIDEAKSLLADHLPKVA